MERWLRWSCTPAEGGEGQSGEGGSGEGWSGEGGSGEGGLEVCGRESKPAADWREGGDGKLSGLAPGGTG